VAAHLAGCPECADELARLERASRVIGQVVREQPPADLRERTLATVRAAGVRRGAPVGREVAGATTAATSIPVGRASGGATATAARAATGSGGHSVLGWVAAIAAAVTISVIATSVIVGGQVDQRLAAQANEIEALERVTIATLEVTSEADARRVALTTVSGPAAAGRLVFSPSTSELVVVAAGLTPPPEGQEYRCWVELAGDREGVGKMFFSDDLAYWIGPVEAVEGLVGEARFGVTLVTLDGSADGQDVLEGDL
jgi:hypothetical protein